MFNTSLRITCPYLHGLVAYLHKHLTFLKFKYGLSTVTTYFLSNKVKYNGERSLLPTFPVYFHAGMFRFQFTHTIMEMETVQRLTCCGFFRSERATKKG